MQFGSENDDKVKRTVFFNSQDETEIIIQTKDEWVQQYLLNRALNDYNCYAPPTAS